MHFISIDVLTEKEAKVNFLKNRFEIVLNEKVIAIRYLKGHLY
jgi:hypothetical protein